ncbi:MAG: (Fe-S)-binding protein [Candidatus Hodarchaeota archaeon]
MSKLENLKKEWEAIMACMGCGDCGYAIRPFAGRYLTCPIKEAKTGDDFEIYFSRGRMNVLKSILMGQIPLSQELAELIYQCSECGNCTEVCHQSRNDYILLPTCNWIDHVKVWEALRKDLVEAGFAPIDRHIDIVANMNNDIMRNPYGENKDKKYEWIAEFPNIKEKGEFVFFAGCTMPLRQSSTLKNMVKILQAAGKELAISKEEWCCGSIGLRIGETIEETLKYNVDMLKDMGAKKVFTACAGCYRTLKKDYPEIIREDLPFEVNHITEILVEMLNNNEIPFKSEELEKIKITYHDPCHLGRHMDLYDIPREVIFKIPGIEFIEMKRNKKNAWCCGAGGGVKSQFPELALDISKERIKEATETEAQFLITSCPFCVGSLSDAWKEMEPETQNKIKVIDIIDFIASLI